MDRILLSILTALFMASSCMPEMSQRVPVSVESNASNNFGDDQISEDHQEVSSPAKWYDNGTLYSVITLDEDSAKNIFLYGDDVSIFLDDTDNFNSDYCALINFQATLDKSPKQLRVKLLPLTSWNSATGKKTNYFRVNTNTSVGNEICNVNKFNQDILTADTYNAATTTNQLDQICDNCLNIITSTDVKIYKVFDSTVTAPDGTVGSNFLSQVDSQSIGYGDLTFRVDLNNNSSTNVPSCSNSNCQAQGFDCCLQSQCVNDAALKNSREVVEQMSIEIGDPNFLTEFDLAQSLMTTNPLTYLQYPQYYYICLETVSTDGTSNPLDPDDPEGDARERLMSMISDYFCIEELKNNSLSDPFHNDPYNTGASYNICHTSEPSSTDPSMFYQDVMERMYGHCGCVYDSYNEMVANCPKYTYTPVFNTSGEEFELADAYTLLNDQGVSNLLDIEDLPELTGIARVECLSPEVDPNILPFQEMNVIVNSKTAPHRFFDKDLDSSSMSIEITDIADVPDNASGEQEGDTFQYLDDSKTFPLNGAFNMNSILGQIKVDLSGAYPAKLVELEFDKMYYIATIEGFYTPCPTCAKDSWFPNFSPNPTTLYGTGLQSIGYTTKRDSWGSNTTFGNYEDTIFGRACWVPPTMLPFSHNEDADQQTQRLNRLKTQSAMFVNGYQRDWFGFNKGALIGSFDGVSWFAIGKGRIIKSTTDRLYLAINAPFADLTQYNDHIVSVQEWDFMTTGPHYDYNTEESLNSAFQNEAGLCQRHHICEVDSDCITQLGWEYSCVDVNQLKTKWPRFTPNDAIEIANDSYEGSIVSVLAQKELPPGSLSKRCVYRGAGAPCRINYDQISDSGKRKALSCAPNFYCAQLNSADAFNHEVARYATALEDISDPKNHYFGRDANHLGRPKEYISTGNLGSLPTLVQDSIESNLLESDSTGANDFGICRPGKSLPDYLTLTSTDNFDFNEQQKSADPEYRTDYISQISGCNSALYTDLRYSSCPMLDADGNYVHTQDNYIDDIFNYGNFTSLNKAGVANILGHAQNSCGLEALDENASIGLGIDAETLQEDSAFQSIEARTLASSDIQFNPTLARDACFRKAGAVCHTDLDCSPNYKHADIIDLLNPSIFGNEAEKKYWQEHLVCGQGVDEPLIPGAFGSADSLAFNTYDMTQNRCCREIGKDLTMYTEDSTDPSVTESVGLQTHITSGFNPNNPNRYSRYNNLDLHTISLNGENDESLFIRPTSYKEYDSITKELNPLVNHINSAPNGGLAQWLTINASGKRTCCGGNWIRKFADGTNNWTVNRLNFDINNFRCLNFTTPLVNTDDPTPFGLTNAQNNQDSQNTCLDATLSLSGCSQQSFDALGSNDSNTLSISGPSAPVINDDSFLMELKTSDFDMVQDDWEANLFSFFRPFSMYPDGNPDPASTAYLDWSADKDVNLRNNIAVKLPTYITWAKASEEIWGDDLNDESDDNVEVYLEFPYDEGPEYVRCKPVTGVTEFDCTSTDPNAWGGLCSATDPVTTGSTSKWEDNCPVDETGTSPGENGDNCCYVYDKNTRHIKIAHNYAVISNDPDNFQNIANLTTAQFNCTSGVCMGGFYGYEDLSAKFKFTAPGTLAWEQKYVSVGVNVPTNTTDALGNQVIRHRRSATAGSAYYYLKRLENFELLGIPQITYMPMYCNDNYQQMVPGIFKSSYNNEPLTNINEFNAHPSTFLAGNSGTLQNWAKPFENDSAPGDYNADSINKPMLATQELVDHEPIFSDHDFMCCKSLGMKVASGEEGTCCSGYAIADGDSGNSADLYCKLPPGTDLNVYLNKFVSSEGMNDDLTDPLLESDFDLYSGFPLFNTNVTNKLKLIAQQYCHDGDYTVGGAFGPFIAEPHGSLGKFSGDDDVNNIYSLVDSVYDDGANDDRLAGFYNAYNLGLKWNHHIYCTVILDGQ